jgi:molybdate transport system substrate-binding protein
LKKTTIYIFVLFIFIALIQFVLKKPEPENTLYIAAASSVRFAFEEIGELFERERGIKPIFQFGASGMLSHQIENGAPFDLFASADVTFIENLAAKGYLKEDSTILYAKGRIAIAVKRDSNIEPTFQSLKKEVIDKITIANPSHAPYGRAAMEALKAVGLWEEIYHKLVFGENISQTFQYVQRGDVPVGIIALSHGVNNSDVIYKLIDESFHSPIEQMLGITSNSKKNKEAKEFVEFIFSSKGRKIMEKYGFYVP